jgi:hypothetical protein
VSRPDKASPTAAVGTRPRTGPGAKTCPAPLSQHADLVEWDLQVAAIACSHPIRALSCTDVRVCQVAAARASVLEHFARAPEAAAAVADLTHLAHPQAGFGSNVDSDGRVAGGMAGWSDGIDPGPAATPRAITVAIIVILMIGPSPISMDM